MPIGIRNTFSARHTGLQHELLHRPRRHLDPVELLVPASARPRSTCRTPASPSSLVGRGDTRRRAGCRCARTAGRAARTGSRGRRTGRAQPTPSSRCRPARRAAPPCAQSGERRRRSPSRSRHLQRRDANGRATSSSGPRSPNGAADWPLVSRRLAQTSRAQHLEVAICGLGERRNADGRLQLGPALDELVEARRGFGRVAEGQARRRRRPRRSSRCPRTGPGGHTQALRAVSSSTLR